MTDNAFKYVRSDAWLLLAILYAGREGGASLNQVKAAGDFINHAVFTADELTCGLNRLSAGGFIKERRGLFSVTSKVFEAYLKTTTPRRAAHKELEDIERFLNIRS